MHKSEYVPLTCRFPVAMSSLLLVATVASATFLPTPKVEHVLLLRCVSVLVSSEKSRGGLLLKGVV